MLIRLCADQLKENWEVINRTIDVSFPECAQVTKNSLLRDLMLDVADCWFYYIDKGKDLKAVFITRFNDDYIVGRKTFTVVAAYALDGGSKEMFVECFDIGKRYAKTKGCDFMDFYTDNPAILRYIRTFDIFWQSTYIQLGLSD